MAGDKEIKDSGFRLADIWMFFKSNLFIYNLIRIFIFILLVWILNSLLLNLYTNHGQKLRLPNYIGQPLSKIEKLAAGKGYELIITDSIHLIGKPGGYVLNQVPKPNSFVKRGRAIYLTVSRYKADELISDNLTTLYGEKFDFKKQEFESLYQLKLVVEGTKYDPGPTGHILEARYKGELIADQNNKRRGVILAKGDTIYVIISVNQGAELDLPNLRCKTLAEARFELEASTLHIANVMEEGTIDNLDEAIIISQDPPWQQGKKIKMNSQVNVTVQSSIPSDCN